MEAHLIVFDKREQDSKPDLLTAIQLSNINDFEMSKRQSPQLNSLISHPGRAFPRERGSIESVTATIRQILDK